MLERISLAFLAAVLVATVSCKIVNAEVVKVKDAIPTTRDEKCGDGLDYSLSGGVLTIQGTGSMYDYDDSSSVSPWYQQRDEIIKVVLKEGVTSIGQYAFFNCSSLTIVSIPATLSLVEVSAFSLCINLTTIDVSDGNINFTSIDGVLFDDQINKIVRYPPGIMNSSYTIPDSVTIIGAGAFSQCAHLNIVGIPTAATTIEDGAFSTSNLGEVTIPNGVKSVGHGAFASCKSLSKVSIPSSVVFLGTGAFYSCSNLLEVEIPDSIPSIGGGTFAVCTSLTRVTIPSSVKSIANGAFSNCSSLRYLTIKNGLETIEAAAFDLCTSLSHLTLPDSVKRIQGGSFTRCASLSAVFYQGSTDFDDYIFSGCPKLINVCMSPYYNSTTFCKLNVTSDTELCQTFRKLFNECSIPAYEDDHFIEQKRKNTTEWESRSNGCMEYKCVKDYGFVSWSSCNSSEEIHQICLNEQCTEEKRIDKKAYVEIEMNKGVKVAELNLTEILDTVSSLCKISSDAFKIGYELDSDGFVIRIFFYVDKDETAKIIAEMVSDSLNNGSECRVGILCMSKTVRVVVSVESQSLSGVIGIHDAALNILLVFIILNILIMLI